MVVLGIDVIAVLSTLMLDKWHHVDPPAGGGTDTSAAVGWVGVVGAIIAFGCYGILIKTPAVVRAQVDAMVFQVYFSVAVALTSFAIWLVAGSSEGLTFNKNSFSMGALFGFLWISSQIFAYNGIKRLGYAVGPAIWIGVTICVSFVWGCAVFSNPIVSVPGSAVAIIALICGVCLAAASSVVSDALKKRARENLIANREMAEEAKEDESGQSNAGDMLIGLACCIGVGLTNGSLMMPMSCFQSGCESINVNGFDGDQLAPLAFLPSLAAGVLAVQPVMFLLYYGRQLLAGEVPKFHVRVATVPGLLTGVFWSLGNFNAMFATVYLGQTIGFPLTQTCIVLNGLWGILYFKEIAGKLPISLFALGSLIIIAGAVLDGKFG